MRQSRQLLFSKPLLQVLVALEGDLCLERPLHPEIIKVKRGLRNTEWLFGTFCTWNHGCSDDGSETEFTKETLNQLKEKSPVRFRYTLRMHWAFFRPFRVGNIPLRGFTTRPSVSPVRCFKTFWFSTSNNGPFYFFNVLPEMELPWVASGTSNEHAFLKDVNFEYCLLNWLNSLSFKQWPHGAGRGSRKKKNYPPPPNPVRPPFF